MTTRGSRFVIALLGLALVSTPLAAAAQSSQGLGEETYQGRLDPDVKAKVIASHPNKEITFECSGVTLRIYPDGTVEAPGTLWCTITILERASRGVTWSKNTYRLEYTLPPGRVPPNRLKAMQVITRTWQYVENNRPSSRDFPPTHPRPLDIGLTKRGTDVLFGLPNGIAGHVEDVPWRLVGRAQPPPAECGPMDVSPATLPDGTVGVPYRQQIGGTGGTAPYTLEISAGVPPEGVTLAWMGAFGGTPTEAGTYSFMLRATDLNDCVAVRRYTIVIRARTGSPPPQPPPPPRRWPTGPGAGPYHEFAALCRVGWAGALARHSVGPADATIADHLRVAGQHLETANQTTFDPLRAWPDWSSHANWLDARIGELNRYGDRARGSLPAQLEQHAQAMINELAVQAAGEVVRQVTCDSLYAALGYQMCYTQQAFQIAEAAERQGQPEIQRRATADGQRLVAAVDRMLREMPTLRLATGRCVDLGEIARILGGDSPGSPIGTRVATYNQAVTRALTLLVPPAPEPSDAPWLVPERCGAERR